MTSEAFDRWRVVPRLLAVLYGLYAFQVGKWFMGLEDPSAAQAAFVSTIWGAAAAWFGLYVNSGNKQ